MIDADKMAELRRLAEEATPGPWRTSERELTIEDEEGQWVADCHGFNLGRPHAANAAFIAAAHTALPVLLDEVERLRAEREETGNG